MLLCDFFGYMAELSRAFLRHQNDEIKNNISLTSCTLSETRFLNDLIILISIKNFFRFTLYPVHSKT